MECVICILDMGNAQEVSVLLSKRSHFILKPFLLYINRDA